MSGHFETASEAEAYAREWLYERAEGGPDGSGDRPMYADEAITDCDALDAQIADDLQAMADESGIILPDDALALHADLMWRECARVLGGARLRELVDHYLRPSPEAEMECLIRTIGPGYHPDTPYDGYEPPITQFTRSEWEFIHRRFEQDRTDLRDIYEFGLDLLNEMLDAQVVRYRDGSRSDQVVMEEVREFVDLYEGGNYFKVTEEILSWSDAGKAAFLAEGRRRGLVG